MGPEIVCEKLDFPGFWPFLGIFWCRVFHTGSLGPHNTKPLQNFSILRAGTSIICKTKWLQKKFKTLSVVFPQRGPIKQPKTRKHTPREDKRRSLVSHGGVYILLWWPEPLDTIKHRLGTHMTETGKPPFYSTGRDFEHSAPPYYFFVI